MSSASLFRSCLAFAARPVDAQLPGCPRAVRAVSIRRHPGDPTRAFETDGRAIRCHQHADRDADQFAAMCLAQLAGSPAWPRRRSFDVVATTSGAHHSPEASIFDDCSVNDFSWQSTQRAGLSPATCSCSPTATVASDRGFVRRGTTARNPNRRRQVRLASCRRPRRGAGFSGLLPALISRRAPGA